MDSKVKSLTRALKDHDRELFARRDHNGIIVVYRWVMGSHQVPWIGDGTLTVLEKQPEYIFALTDTWGPRGRGIDAGIEVVLARLKYGDTHNRDVLEDLEKQEARDKESSDRKLRSDADAYAREHRREFAKITNDINTSNLSKHAPRGQ